MDGLKIQRIRISNYRGVEVLDTAAVLPGGTIPPGGVLIKGPNAAGKTSVLRGIRAALAGQDIGDDAIRLGTDRAEILIDLDCASVKRVLARGEDPTIDVRADGRQVRAPAKWLKELLGASPLDPIEWYRLEPAKRRAALLAAIPIELPRDKALAAIDAAKASAGVLPYREACAITERGGHALTACAAIARVFFDTRTEVNRALKEAEQAAEKVLEGGPLAPPSAENLIAKADEAARVVLDLEARDRAAKANESARASTLEQIAALRRKAKAVLDPEPIGAGLVPGEESLPSPEEARAALVAEREGGVNGLELANTAREEVTDRIRKIEAAMEKARGDMQRAIEYQNRSKQKRDDADRAIERHDAAQAAAAKEKESAAERARDWLAQADGLQASVALTAPAPKAEELEGARARKHAAAAASDLDTLNRARRATLSAAEAAATKARADVEVLTRAVDAFRDQIPRALVAHASGIQGLSLEGDRVLLDGVHIDECSGMEQLRFAVEIARRANARSKILVVDGLESLDPEQNAMFLKAATAGGYQLICTRVDAGESVFEAIASDEVAT